MAMSVSDHSLFLSLMYFVLNCGCHSI